MSATGKTKTRLCEGGEQVNRKGPQTDHLLPQNLPSQVFSVVGKGYSSGACPVLSEPWDEAGVSVEAKERSEWRCVMYEPNAIGCNRAWRIKSRMRETPCRD
jgi:hypothetical protein